MHKKIIAVSYAAETLDNGILTVKCSWKRTWWDLPLLSLNNFFFPETPWKIKERKNNPRHAGKYLVLCCSQLWELGSIFWTVLNYRPFDYARHLALMSLAFNADSMTNKCTKLGRTQLGAWLSTAQNFQSVRDGKITFDFSIVGHISLTQLTSNTFDIYPIHLLKNTSN